MPIYGSGDNIRDWLYAEDHGRALVLIVQRGRPGKSYNVGGRNEHTNLAVVQTICDQLDALQPGNRPRRELIRVVVDRPGHDQRYAIDATKLDRRFGWRAQESFETRIAKTVRWYIDRGDWWRPPDLGIYVKTLDHGLLRDT